MLRGVAVWECFRELPYRAVARSRRMCLVGIVMSEHSTTAAKERDGRLSFSDVHLRKHRYWVSVIVLASADVLAFAAAYYLFCRGAGVPKLFRSEVPISSTDVLLVLGVLFVIVRYLCGDYGRRQLFWDSARATTVALFITSIPSFVMLGLGQFGFDTEHLSVLAIAGSWLFLIFAIPGFRQLARLGMRSVGLWNIPTTLVASGTRAEAVYRALTTALSLGYDVRWLVVDAYEKEPPEALRHLRCAYLTEPGDIVGKIDVSGCDNVVIAIDDMQSPIFASLIQRLMEADIAVSFVPSFLRLPLVRVSTSYFFGRDVLLFQVSNNLRRFPYRLLKRGFDIVGSLVLLVLFSPVFVAMAVAIKRFDNGPVIYRQKRTGLHGAPFMCLKFRTMAVDADERLYRWRQEKPELYEQYLKTMKLADDPRVTVPGKWLRKASLDELPQLVNVLRGEMSLVGPRPVVERELIEFYGPAAQIYKRVRPGLTGLWQVSGRSDTSYEERVVYDEWYILNWSFWYDIVIVLQTAWVVLSRKGAY